MNRGEKMTKWILMAALSMGASLGYAVEMLDYLTDEHGKYRGPSVEDNIAQMDTDHNGFADVAEVRAFLALKYGADYQKALLDRWEIVANTKSCGTSFAQELVK
jgi:hypothetical protein